MKLIKSFNFENYTLNFVRDFDENFYKLPSLPSSKVATSFDFENTYFSFLYLQLNDSCIYTVDYTNRKIYAKSKHLTRNPIDKNFTFSDFLVTEYGILLSQMEITKQRQNSNNFEKVEFYNIFINLKNNFNFKIKSATLSIIHMLEKISQVPDELILNGYININEIIDINVENLHIKVSQ